MKKKRKIYDGQWISGAMPGLEKLLTYKRVIKILEAKTPEEVEEYVNMSDLKLISTKTT